MYVPTFMGNARNQSCVVFPYKGLEISIALDDSCGCLKELSRADIKIFSGPDFSKDITKNFPPFDEHDASLENLITIKSIIDKELNHD